MVLTTAQVILVQPELRTFDAEEGGINLYLLVVQAGLPEGGEGGSERAEEDLGPGV